MTTLQGRIDSANRVVSARAGLTAALAADRDLSTQTKQFVADYKAWLVVTYRSLPDVLADYGVAPPKKPAPRTAATKVVAAAKAKATRAARHTVGSRKKAEIKGALAGPVVIEPSPAPVAQPTDAAAPAAQAPAANAGNGGSPPQGVGGGPGGGAHS